MRATTYRRRKASLAPNIAAPGRSGQARRIRHAAVEVRHECCAAALWRSGAPEVARPLRGVGGRPVRQFGVAMLALPNCSGPCMNVLYLLSDDMRADRGTYGLPTKTPNLDRLAAEGLLFTHAYCQMSVCSPSRQSFMSRRPDKNKVWNFLDHNPLYPSDAGRTFGMRATWRSGSARRSTRMVAPGTRIGTGAPTRGPTIRTAPTPARLAGRAAATASRRMTRFTTIAFASRRWTTSALRRRRGETRRARFT